MTKGILLYHFISLYNQIVQQSTIYDTASWKLHTNTDIRNAIHLLQYVNKKQKAFIYTSNHTIGKKSYEMGYCD